MEYKLNHKADRLTLALGEMDWEKSKDLATNAIKNSERVSEGLEYILNSKSSDKQRVLAGFAFGRITEKWPD
jgi:hypothetical protein